MSGFAQNLNYATQYQRALEQAYPYVLHFGRLYATPNNGRFRWVNSKTIEIPSISTSGRTNADRDSIGTAQRNYNNAWETKTLVNERKWSTLVHPKDIDQTNMAASITNITTVFNEEHKFPEMDAYTISKIYYDWSTSVAGDAAHDAYIGHSADTTPLTVNNVLEVFDKLMLAMDNARVPVAGRVLYCTNEVKVLLKNAAEIRRNWDVQANDPVINRVVNRLDEVEIIGVPAELMKTKYDFSDVNGWAVAPTASQINMCLILPTAVITPVSYTFSKLDAPSALTEGKYYYYEEAFEDVFILNKKADAIQFNVTPYGPAVDVTLPSSDTVLIDKPAGDIQLAVLNGNRIEGISKYVADWSSAGFTGHNFVAIHVAAPAATVIKAGLDPTAGTGLVTLDPDGLFVGQVASNSQVIKVVATDAAGNETTQVISLAGLELKQA
jgi:hypothetical protein